MGRPVSRPAPACIVPIFVFAISYSSFPLSVTRLGYPAGTPLPVRPLDGLEPGQDILRALVRGVGCGG